MAGLWLHAQMTYSSWLLPLQRDQNTSWMRQSRQILQLFSETLLPPEECQTIVVQGVRALVEAVRFIGQSAQAGFLNLTLAMGAKFFSGI